MFNADRLLSDLIGGGLSGGGLGRKRYRYRRGGGMGDAIGRTVMSPQGLTILGGLAIAAYEHFKGQKDPGAAGPPGGPISAGTPPPFLPPPAPAGAIPAAAPGTPGGGVVGGAVDPGGPAGEERARLLIAAMVSAAKADGTIDPEERERILGRLAERGAGDAERAYLEEEMARPLDMERWISQVHDPVLAAEVYAASLLAIDPDTPAEKAYLAMLGARLNLEPGMIRELESRLDAAGA
jgi:uncharacterized membrane protein YebE (DUF533 family)